MPDSASINVLWVLICAGEVMLMQLGFCMLESGLVRSKNSINVAIKNLADFCIAGLLFYLIGFPIMFGGSFGGLFGITGFGDVGTGSGMEVAFFLFQMVFACTAATIVSGAVAERTSFHGYVFLSAMITVLIYPVSGHWIWGDGGWLRDLGFLDFAGSTAVHSVGGWLALAAVIVIGPRHGRFDTGEFKTSSHSLVVATFGVIVLFFGWYGFNGGSLLAFNDHVPSILVNTTLAGLAGGSVNMVAAQWYYKYGELRQTLNGVIGGLVAITACCNVVTGPSSILIGAIGGLIAFAAGLWLEKRKIDDVVGASAAHAFPGVWGTLAVAIFGDAEAWGTGHSFWEQLGVQALGCGVVFAWAFGIGILLVRGLSLVTPLRVPIDHEQMGLNIAEHGATTEIIDLLDDMSIRRRSGEFEGRVKADPFTEVGQIASEYNLVLGKVSEEMGLREEASERLRIERDRVRELNREYRSSIAYAQTIQQAFLPHGATLESLFPKYGLIFRPRDVVSGDFYWIGQAQGSTYVAVADCTGHGVPGAFMSIIGITFMGQILTEQDHPTPSSVLEALNKRVRRALKQDQGSGNVDGMEIALLRIDNEQLLFAGARRPLWIQDARGALTEVRGSRNAIGGPQRMRASAFSDHEIARRDAFRLFLFTDGLSDQPNEQRRPLDLSALRHELNISTDESISEQTARIEQLLNRHQAEAAQRDDITLLALEL
ncbi:MAG: ammonium transporter [Puniceicoccales bacterium]